MRHERVRVCAAPAVPRAVPGARWRVRRAGGSEHDPPRRGRERHRVGLGRRPSTEHGRDRADGAGHARRRRGRRTPSRTRAG